MSTRPYVHIIITYGDTVTICNEGRRYTMFFCLRSVVHIKITEQIEPLILGGGSRTPETNWMDLLFLL